MLSYGAGKGQHVEEEFEELQPATWRFHIFLLRLGRIKLPGASEKLRRGSFMGLIALVPSYPSGEMEQ